MRASLFFPVHRHPQSGVSGVERLIRPLRSLVGLRSDARTNSAARSTSTPVFSSAESMASRTRVVGQMGQRRERLVGAATRVMSEGPRPVPPVRSKRAMLNVRHHVELERPPSQLLALRGAGQAVDASGKWPVARVPNTSVPAAGLRDWTPSSHLSRGSFRSDWSGTSSALHRHTSHMSPESKSSQRLPHSFVQNVSPLSSYQRAEHMRSASAATLSRPSLTDLSFGRRPVSAFEDSPVARPSPFPRSEGSIAYEQHIYQNQMQLMNRPHIAMQSVHSSSSSPFARTLVLRDSQRRRFDDRIAQIRRERESTRVGRIRPQVSAQAVPPNDPPTPPSLPQRADASSSLSSEEGEERLCQV